MLYRKHRFPVVKLNQYNELRPNWFLIHDPTPLPT